MEKVEKWKLTPEQIAWSKQYAQLLKVAQMVNQGMVSNMVKARGLSDMLKQIEGGMQEMINKAPANPTRELPEQAPLADSFQINY